MSANKPSIHWELHSIALLVREYDEALAFYVGQLGFELVEDSVVSETKRWVVIRPPGNHSCHLLLARAVGAEQISRVGNQTGGRVFLFLHTNDIDRDYGRLLSAGIRIVREPTTETFGKVLVWADLYGNLWDLIEPAGIRNPDHK